MSEIFYNGVSGDSLLEAGDECEIPDNPCKRWWPIHKDHIGKKASEFENSFRRPPKENQNETVVQDSR